jgi:DNA-binding transcriptional MerR regulator/predicted transcriptional regulator YdeE
MLKIGEFSRLCRVPVSALRYYADLGLLAPAQIDPANGYRYYQVEQLPRLHRILALRDLGLSLEQIGQMLRESLSPEQLHGMLRLRQSQLTQQVADGEAQLARVSAWLHHIEQEGTMSDYDVVLKELEPQLVAGIRSVIPSYGAIGALFDELLAYLRTHGTGGLAVGLDHNDEYKERDPDMEAVAYLAAPVPEGGRVKVYTLPAVTVASTIHRGPWEEMSRAYAALMSWLQTSGYTPCGASRELYHHMGATPAEHVTEIQIPVTRT